MSLLSVVEEAIKSYKAEQAKINDSIQLYREILQTLTPQLKACSEEPECADNSATDTNISPGKTEDLALLERALEKALHVRTASRVSEKDPKRNKHPGPQKEAGATSVLFKDVTQSSAPYKGSQTTIRSTSKSKASLDRKCHKRPGSSTLGSRPSASYNPGQSKTINNRNRIQNHSVSSVGAVYHQTARKSQLDGSTHASLTRIPTLQSKNATVRSNSDDDLEKADTASSPSNDTVPYSHIREWAHSVPQQNGTLPEQAAKWKSLRTKENRLWDKVISLQRKSMPGNSHFMERMRAMFPKDWPCGSPDQIRVLVDRLTHQSYDLTHHCQTKELLAKHIPEVATELGGKDSKYDCSATLERLQMTPAELQGCADQVKEEWEAWDRWKPEGGCLCPTGANGLTGDEVIAPLPLTITYTTEAELRELENLRMRVALLLQEIYLEQALLDTLSPLLSCVLPGPGCPEPSVLRDVYSLLGEGGECFPSTVLDSELD
ncbi:tubulin epsilon and delta complex protein 2 [Anabas testudineus]|uniref:tubulin epsilon and delta complex protein 2 n=1 Tax=Anabas testudineus TaxID=64144 RepID=UPI000E45B797|nr:tubulin epsilon and delta complex protein 2 [Anabas testudineus]XP_026200823.1 tubulin epsilon and delta complex protein 2 [Anabas testudineus]XP_026200833.1 tubulin epsilon and delta complex protein 2 [Anabas testudineus]